MKKDILVFLMVLASGCVSLDDGSSDNSTTRSTVGTSSTTYTTLKTTSTLPSTSTTSTVTVSSSSSLTLASTTTSVVTSTTPVCRDTDGGTNYNIHGTVIHADGTVRNDLCEGDMLKEYFCKDGEINSVYYNCRYGCIDGRCRQEQ